MEILAKRNEMALFSITSLMSFGANLPPGALENFIDQRMLLVTLGASVLIALFQYLQLLLSTVMVVSSVGAGLPPELASAVGVHPPILAATLTVIVSLVLMNRLYNLLPTGIATENPERVDTSESRESVLAAISKGNQSALRQMIAKNIEINFIHNDTSPILLAAEKGYADITQMLIRHGADFQMQNQAGLTPIDIALSKKFIRTSEILYLAAKVKLENMGDISGNHENSSLPGKISQRAEEPKERINPVSANSSA